MTLIITCEHASNRIPEEQDFLFDSSRDLLATHQAYDPGAVSLARYLSKEMSGALFAGKYSRLLVDLNRKERNRRVFSWITAGLSDHEKKTLLEKYHAPYRKAVFTAVQKLISAGESIGHFSIHTFTPVLNGKTRNADIGLLYDPARGEESRYSKMMKQEMLSGCSGLRVRLNYPYKGSSDGITSWLRYFFEEDRYMGWEIEINQSLLMNGEFPESLNFCLLKALKKVSVPG